ncbi:hypothetical protein [Streptomyces cyaneofuscatus]|uniref:hypothetical protein n=1 Tax=Streptomyces cyaneofuscatus TaxID=66883 RepID=UPI0004C7D723|nr:hypothetical protein [Streptomyces cyaneofuscatus]NDZ65958.1 hypothetical protein [Streptomyces cyaneofuscatus]
MSVRLLRLPVPLTRSRAWGAVVSTVLACATTVGINVWTSSWAWPAGAGLGTLLLTQAIFEWVRARVDAPVPSPARMTVEQSFSDVTDSKITAVDHQGESGDTEVRQRFGTVSRSTIVGIEGSRR